MNRFVLENIRRMNELRAKLDIVDVTVGEDVAGEVINPDKQSFTHLDDNHGLIVSGTGNEITVVFGEDGKMSVKSNKKNESPLTPLHKELMPIFFNAEENVRQFVKEINNAKDNAIFEIINRYNAKDLMVKASTQKTLYEILSKYGLIKCVYSTYYRNVN